MAYRLFLFVLCFCSYQSEANEEVEILTNSYTFSVADRSTAPTYITVNLEDIATKTQIKLVIENIIFSTFIMDQQKLSFDGYVEYMMDHDGRNIEISFDELKNSLTVQLGSISNAHKYLTDNTYRQAYTLDKFEVETVYQLLEKYFEFNEKYKNGHFRQNSKNINLREPEFIAMLLNLGCVVRRGDLVPLLMVSYN